MWINKKLYWAWVEDRKKDEAGRYIGEIPDTPTEKRIDYAAILGHHKLAIGVWDDERYTPLHRDELAFFTTQHGR